ncbi:hypothetical protein G7Y89_g4450 [Cudoniella acicularis]|uniref:Uncharacterized protein n=1 Tax=Cudoniella acicularis TaxID=354080 RepID=A0A8H4RPF1_9HELO|nr:hypothetical protein G7Y89_g4450 [Cudoniella acicularis]
MSKSFEDLEINTSSVSILRLRRPVLRSSGSAVSVSALLREPALDALPLLLMGNDGTASLRYSTLGFGVQNCHKAVAVCNFNPHVNDSNLQRDARASVWFEGRVVLAQASRCHWTFGWPLIIESGNKISENSGARVVLKIGSPMTL